MKSLLYITSNQDKFNKAKLHLLPFGIDLIQNSCQMEELQTNDGNVIAKHKAEQAYQIFKQPLIVNDDSWSIPALNGFPATNMKQCNDFLVAEDWLRLMSGKQDRRIFLTSYYAFIDGSSIRTISTEYERCFLDKPQGKHQISPVLEIVARNGSSKSAAEEIAEGITLDDTNQDFWQEFAQMLLN